MNPPPLVPDGAALRQAIRWLAEHRGWTAAGIDEASRLFDLSPTDEEFLLREAHRMHHHDGAPGTPTSGR